MVPRSTPILLAKPMRRGTQVGLFQSVGFFGDFPFIKRGLRGHLHATIARIVYGSSEGSRRERASSLFLGAFTALDSMQVTAALMLTARYLNTPGGNFRSIWPNIQVNISVTEIYFI